MNEGFIDFILRKKVGEAEKSWRCYLLAWIINYVKQELHSMDKVGNGLDRDRWLRFKRKEDEYEWVFNYR